ncbi:MAG TPA: ScaI family restriction endonuclease [Planctomycetota bacterium]
MKSPYQGLPLEKWKAKTQELIDAHPLKRKELVEAAFSTWESIFRSRIGPSGFRIGKDLFPKPQIMGFFLHELLPLELATRHPRLWRGDKASDEKDLVYIPDPAKFSVEIKTSSSLKCIFGNRSYAQVPTEGKKLKSGYYLALNFEKFSAFNRKPKLLLVRFGWLDHSDWVGQHAESGQQCRLPPPVEQSKLITLNSGE